MDNLTNAEQLAQIAQDYYLSKITIGELTEKYGVSRYLISKYLEQALEEGIVTIQINSPVSRNFQLEAQFSELFNIDHVYILKNQDNPTNDGSNIITYAAQQIQALVIHSKIVGISWGGTMFNLIDHFHTDAKPDITFTQYMGENMKYNSLAGSTRMVEHAANKLGANYLTIPAPLYVVNKSVREGLKKEPALSAALHAATNMDLIFCGLGTLASVNSIEAWKNSREQIFPGVKPSEVAGMLFGRPYDIKGNFLIPTEDTTFGVPLSDILKTPRRFGVLKSRFKTDAALGALRGNMLTDIVLDESIAHRILSANKES
ncbi:sugar-binding transcriptional regulator [Pediococcus claussenii]|uniref:Sugar-binding domain protein n=1 Tax=Pediococcus claussenii (strain ATCC BAA-344 / DSM 14800 / JCM 18046 / KCTC 3811 / LMG 21948 / P06) TaxID=701521 RepID=G8PAD0_PEDCP|nr:sugar-binding domain-containing protein [Pediococcus claussenii]AEV94569.1 putative sugar-binding domain protein [Pediococcus claussenii ATCC BAA-344]ANZ69784.1 citrate lyase [Pediococcus claussenii]ANZ71601.1 citrate lyase [Pediococcus claussenii]KRN19725.1 hypothetical protein IV79_GL001012 [Pediococcus claussenii]